MADALVGWRGLSTWRTQLREGRQVEHAEKALAAAGSVFSAIRAARRWEVHIEEEDIIDPTIIGRGPRERLGRAWTAFLHFEERYALAGLYSDRTNRQLDVASEIGGCLAILSQRAAAIWSLEQDTGQSALGTAEWTAFYGPPLLHPARDDIEERLLKAQQALQAELGAILLPKARRSGRRWAHDTSNGTSSLDLDGATEKRLVDALRSRALNAREIKVITQWATPNMRPGLQRIANKRGLTLDVRAGLGGGVLYRFYTG